MSDPDIVSNELLRFGDLEIALMNHDGERNRELEQRDDVYYMMKSLPYIDSYRQVRAALTRSGRANPASNVLEVGVFRGGSAPFLHRFFDAQRIVCVDLLAGVVPLERYRAATGDILRTHYGLPQNDQAALRRSIAADFEGPIDLVVDDASHLYAESKATFEAVFPHLRPGGIYVLEDWAWSHHESAQTADHFWADRGALTSLVFELTAAYGAPGGPIAAIGFAAGLMWVERSRLALDHAAFTLEPYLRLRGKTLAPL